MVTARVFSRPLALRSLSSHHANNHSVYRLPIEPQDGDERCTSATARPPRVLHPWGNVERKVSMDLYCAWGHLPFQCSKSHSHGFLRRTSSLLSPTTIARVPSSRIPSSVPRHSSRSCCTAPACIALLWPLCDRCVSFYKSSTRFDSINSRWSARTHLQLTPFFDCPQPSRVRVLDSTIPSAAVCSVSTLFSSSFFHTNRVVVFS